MEFKELNLIQPLLDAVESAGYRTPTPIQTATIPLFWRAGTFSAARRPGPARRRPSRCLYCKGSPVPKDRGAAAPER